MNVSFDKNAPSAVATPAPVIDVAATVTSSVPVTTPPAPVAVPVPQPATNPAPVATPVPQPATIPAPVAVPATTPTGGAVARSGGLILGDKIPDFGEIMMPRLNIAQSIGELGKSFDIGSIVFDQRIVLFNPPIVDAAAGKVVKEGLPPVGFVCLGFRPTRYVEKVKGGGRGLIVNTEDEVRANGGTLDYKEHQLKEKDGMKRFEPMAEALIAIERPAHLADDDTLFVYPVDGKKYALAFWAIKGTAYTAACKKVLFMQRAIGCLNRGYPTFSFALSTRWSKFDNGNGAWVPVLIPQKASSPEFLAWVANVLNPAQAADQGAQ